MLRLAVFVTLIAASIPDAWAQSLAKAEPVSPQTPSSCVDCVRPLKEMRDIKEFSELRRFGLVGPEERDHEAGTNLILLALGATAYGKGDWVQAIGLLGAQMIDVELDVRLAYQAIFQTGFGCTLRNLDDPHTRGNAGLLVPVEWELSKVRAPVPAKNSIIARRETALVAIAETLSSRYRYGPDGNYRRDYGSAPRHPGTLKLTDAFNYGMQVFLELRQQQLTDLTLQAALGAAAASLDHNDTPIPINQQIQIPRFQSYRDALNAAFGRIREVTERSGETDFLSEYCQQLELRELRVGNDALLLPEFAPDAEANHAAMLRIVTTDLAKSRLKTDSGK